VFCATIVDSSVLRSVKIRGPKTVLLVGRLGTRLRSVLRSTSYPRGQLGKTCFSWALVEVKALTKSQFVPAVFQIPIRKSNIYTGEVDT
jgi:hypothetical protein